MHQKQPKTWQRNYSILFNGVVLKIYHRLKVLVAKGDFELQISYINFYLVRRPYKGTIYRIFGLRLGPNLGVLLEAEKSF